MRIVFLGSGEFARPTLDWLSRSEHDVSLVVTQPAKPSGRGRRSTRTPVQALADDLGMEVAEPRDVNAREMIRNIESLGAHLGLVIAFGQKLGAELLGTLPAGFVNLHASLLPKYRGAAPINWAIARGEERSGCTVFKIVEKMDAGPILVSHSTAIEPEETAGELHDRLAGIGVDTTRAALELFEDNQLPGGTPQDETGASSAPKLSKAKGLIRFDRPAADVANHINGMTPWPGATTRFHGSGDRWENVQIVRARRAEDSSPPDSVPGTIGERLYVSADDGFVEILEIKPSSGRIMTWGEYVNGRHVVTGDTFEALEP